MPTKFTLSQKTCPCCLQLVIGRSDKVFCTIKCKNIHHNAARSQLNRQYQQTEKMILRNLIVLEGILGPKSDQMTIHRDTLFRYGFSIHTCTSVTVKNQKITYRIGNYTYTIQPNGIVKVKRIVKEVEDFDLFFNRWEKDFPYDASLQLNYKLHENLIGFKRSIKKE